jgi:tRNA(Ile)-lysidine synthase
MHFDSGWPDPPAAPTHFDSAWLALRLRSLAGTLRHRRLCLAFSGGLDSCALLCALSALRAYERFQLRAVHVNHQLHPHAAQWARLARQNARRLRVPCRVVKVLIHRRRGESLEAAARAARYQALVASLETDELLLTAHHQEDQLETVLLALMRGSGVRGLAGMSADTPLAHTRLLRPLLPVTRAQLQGYLQKQGLSWSEDPSNADERFDRNYLRRAVLPLLRARWPAAAATVSRSASHLADAGRMLEQMARGALSGARDGAALRASVLRRLPLPQRRQALRVWIAERGLPLPDQARMEEIAGPMLSARQDATPCVRWQGTELRRHSDRVVAFRVPEGRSHAMVRDIHQWDWRTQPQVSLGAAGSLSLERDRYGDVQLSALPDTLSVCYRKGGERLRGVHGGMLLKALLQAKGVAPWDRALVPLLMHDGHILAVADLWVAPEYCAKRATGAELGRIHWRRDESRQTTRGLRRRR